MNDARIGQRKKFFVMEGDFGYRVLSENAPPSELTLDQNWYAGEAIMATSPTAALTLYLENAIPREKQ